MTVVEDKEGKTSPRYHQSTGHYSEETGGVPMKHKCWDGVGRTLFKEHAVFLGFSKDPAKTWRRLIAT